MSDSNGHEFLETTINLMTTNNRTLFSHQFWKSKEIKVLWGSISYAGSSASSVPCLLWCLLAPGTSGLDFCNCNMPILVPLSNIRDRQSLSYRNICQGI